MPGSPELVDQKPEPALTGRHDCGDGDRPALVLRRRGSFFYGYLRLASGSVWPASIAHATHNIGTGMIMGFTVTSSPLLVNGYLLGEFGILITAGAAIAAALVSRLVPHDIEEHDSGTQAPLPDHASRPTTSTRRLDSR